MVCLPSHDRIECSICYKDQVKFNGEPRTEGNWRITPNPLAWGGKNPVVVVLGFSKGPNAMGAIASNMAHEDIAYSGKRKEIGQIFALLGLIKKVPKHLPEETRDRIHERAIDELIADPKGKFHFGSLIRCTVENYRQNKKKVMEWQSSGGGMLDKFVVTEFGKKVAENCATKFLSELPKSTKLVLLFGMGSDRKYVDGAMDIISQVRNVRLERINDVAYKDDKVVFVHTEHFASQGNHLTDWLDPKNARFKFAEQSYEAVDYALSR